MCSWFWKTKLEPSNEGNAGAVSAKGAAIEPLVEGPAASDFEGPRTENPERQLAARVPAEAELRAEVVSLHAKGERESRADGFADLPVRVGGGRVVFVAPRIVVAVVEIGRGAHLRGDDAEIQVQALRPHNAVTRRDSEFPSAI